MTQSVYFSVVIPTFNRQHMLGECLQSLERQSFPLNRFEVIVIDDGSTDGTAEAMADFKKRSGLNISFYLEKHGGPGNARNIAAGYARGEVLAFTEDDACVDVGWLEKAYRYFSATDADGLEGKTLVQDSYAPLRLFEEGGQFGFLPCNLFVKKEAFLSVGGFSTVYFEPVQNLYFREDADFGFRLLSKGMKLVFADDVVVTRPWEFPSVRDYFKHARRYFLDPLLHRNYPALFRRYIEVKRIGPWRIHRPLHRMCTVYVVAVLLLLWSIFFASSAYTVFILVLLAGCFLAIKFRYERRSFISRWNVMRILAFIVLPFYYYYWFLRGCFHFKNFWTLI